MIIPLEKFLGFPKNSKFIYHYAIVLLVLFRFVYWSVTSDKITTLEIKAVLDIVSNVFYFV